MLANAALSSSDIPVNCSLGTPSKAKPTAQMPTNRAW
jgi:hypothetical protein